MKKSNPWIDEIPHLSLLVPPLPDFHTGSEGRNELAGLVEEEGLDIMRPLGIFLENCRSLSAWKIWAIWIKRVKLSVGRDEAAGAAGQLGLARGAVESTEQCSEPLAEGSTLPFPGYTIHQHCASSCPSASTRSISRCGGSAGSAPGTWQGTVGHSEDQVLISSSGEHRAVPGGDGISPREERCSWAVSCCQLQEMDVCSWQSWDPMRWDAATAVIP